MKLLPRGQSKIPPGNLSQPAEHFSHDGFDVGIGALVKAMYMPMEVENPESIDGVAWASYALAALMLLLFILTARHPEWIKRLGFLSRHPWRGAGITALTSIFIHFSTAHLLGNLFFLIVFGHDLEKKIGSFHFVEVFALSGVAGCVLSHFLYSQAFLMMGASGGIAGVLVYYLLAFPRARISMSMPLTSRHRSGVLHFSFSAPAALAWFVGFNVAGAWAQLYWLPDIERMLTSTPAPDLSTQFNLLACQVHSSCQSSVGVLQSLLAELREVSFLGHIGGAIAGGILFALQPPKR